MKSKSLVLMVLSLGFGLVAAIGISQVMGRNNNSEAPVIKTRAVIVAADDLEYKTLLTSENVKEEQWPIEIIPANAVTSLEQISDMATKTFVAKKMPISLSNIVHIKQLNNIHIPRGFTVIHIKVSADDTGNGLLQPGDRVNLIGHIKNRPAKTFLKGLRVFAVNAQLTAKTGSREEQGSKSDAIVGILANERQAEMIMQVQREGHLKLSFLGEDFDFEEEGGVIDEEGVRGLGLFEVIQPEIQIEEKQPIVIQAPAPPRQEPKKVQTMKVWSANGLEVVSFRDGVVDKQQPFGGRPVTTPPLTVPIQQPVSNSNDWDKSSDNGGRDTDTEEDQYPS